MAVPFQMRRRVIARAKSRCECCGLSQAGQAATFHMDHIKPTASGGETALNNLALACIHCSLSKGARVKALDPQTGSASPLFHPRMDRWNHHFRWDGCVVVGITPTGRATIEALDLNSDRHQLVRAFESQMGRHPPPGHL